MSSDGSSQSVEYDGRCAFALSIGKTDVEGGKHPVTIGNRTFTFANPVAKLLFNLLPNRLKKADENWKGL